MNCTCCFTVLFITISTLSDLYRAQVGNARPKESLASRPLTHLDPSEETTDPSEVLVCAEAGSKGRDGCNPSNCNDVPVAPAALASLATEAMAVALGDDTVDSRHGKVRLDRRRETFAGQSTPSLVRGNLTRLTAEGLPSEATTRDEGQGLIPRKLQAFFDGQPANERGLPPPPPRYGSTLADRVSVKRSSGHVVRGGDGDGREPRAPGYERETVLERVFRLPSDSAISGCKTPPISDVRRHSFGGVDRRRGLGALSLPNPPRRRTRMIAADSDDAKAESSIAFTAGGCSVTDPGDALAVEETKSSDTNTPSCIAVGATATCNGSSSGRGNEWHTFSLGGDSPALSLNELITSGEFYPGGVSRTPAAAAAATVAAASPAVAGRSDNIGLRGHHQQSTGFDEDARGGEETKTKLVQEMSNFSWDVKCSDYRASNSFAPPPAVQNTVRSVRGNGTPDIPCTCGTIPNLNDTVRRHTNSSQQATSSVRTLEGDRFSENEPRISRLSVSAPGRAFAPDGAASSTDYGVEQQESLDDFLRDLPAVTGGDVAGGGRSRGRLKREGDSFVNKRLEAKGDADVVVAL